MISFFTITLWRPFWKLLIWRCSDDIGDSDFRIPLGISYKNEDVCAIYSWCPSGLFKFYRLCLGNGISTKILIWSIFFIKLRMFKCQIFTPFVSFLFVCFSFSTRRLLYIWRPEAYVLISFHLLCFSVAFTFELPAVVTLTVIGVMNVDVISVLIFSRMICVTSLLVPLS